MGNLVYVEEPLISVFTYRNKSVKIDLLALCHFERVQDYLQTKLDLSDPLVFEYFDANEMCIVCAGSEGWRILLEDLRLLNPKQRVIRVARKKRYFDDIAPTQGFADYYFSDLTSSESDGFF